MLVQKHISEQEVILDFANFINNFCEQYHLSTNKPRPFICKIVIEKFSGKVGHSDDWMRKQIESKYKNQAQSKNGKKRGMSKIDRLKKAFDKAEHDLLEATHETTVAIGNDL